MKYARLENQSLIYAPKITTIGNFLVINPTGDQCESMGYYPVIESPYPENIENGYKAVPVWKEENYQTEATVDNLPVEKKKIIQFWKIVPANSDETEDNRSIPEKVTDLQKRVANLEVSQTLI